MVSAIYHIVFLNKGASGILDRKILYVWDSLVHFLVHSLAQSPKLQ